MGTPLPYKTTGSLPSFRLNCGSFTDGQALPSAQASARFGIPDGRDESPALEWSGAPEGTKGYAVTVFDPDARTGFWHWGVAGVPADATSLPAGAGSEDGKLLPHGAFQLRNDAGTCSYVGAAPPKGSGPHRYIFAIHALDTAEPDIGADAPASALGLMLDRHTLARASLTGIFERH